VQPGVGRGVVRLRAHRPECPTGTARAHLGARPPAGWARLEPRTSRGGAISYVAINVLSVPEGAGSTLEERFAARQGAVDGAPGFEHFELLRPLEGTSDYLVYTRWRSEEDFTAWRSSQSFGAGHAQASGRPEGSRPAATGSTIWAFEVVQTSDATS
jgi:heme-degrading monooxygenase HmoA